MCRKINKSHQRERKKILIEKINRAEEKIYKIEKIQKYKNLVSTKIANE